jgi:hypothetical protein
MLELTITKRIGKRHFHFKVQGANFHETVTEYDRLSFADVPACGLCGSDNLDLKARTTEKGKFKYVSVRCLDCSGDVTFGKRQDDDQTVFLRKNAKGEPDWQAWKKEDEQAS